MKNFIKFLLLMVCVVFIGCETIESITSVKSDKIDSSENANYNLVQLAEFREKCSEQILKAKDLFIEDELDRMRESEKMFGGNTSYEVTFDIPKVHFNQKMAKCLMSLNEMSNDPSILLNDTSFVIDAY